MIRFDTKIFDFDTIISADAQQFCVNFFHKMGLTKKPFSSVKKVVGYLRRYSHQVALTNRRIKNINTEKVSFEYKDYKDHARKNLMTLKGAGFLCRFCLHILPKNFTRVCPEYSMPELKEKGKLFKTRFLGRKKLTTIS